MIEGLNNDDQYIMVEDEFLHTAQLFTRHLHQAEYDRIREQIEKETDKGNRISTLVDIGDASTHRSKDIVRTGVFNEENDNDSRDDDLWAGTMLHSLMTGPAAPPSLAAIHSSQTLYPSPSRKSQNHRGKFKADHGVVYSSPARPIDLVPSDKVSTASEGDEEEITPVGHQSHQKGALVDDTSPSSPTPMGRSAHRKLPPIAERSTSPLSQNIRPSVQRSSVVSTAPISSSPASLHHRSNRDRFPQAQVQSKSASSNPKHRPSDSVDDMDEFATFVRSRRSMTGLSQTPSRTRGSIMSERREKRKKEDEKEKDKLDEVPTFFM